MNTSAYKKKSPNNKWKKMSSIILLILLCLITISSSALAATPSYSQTNYPLIIPTLVGTTPSPAIAGELLEVRIAFQNQGGQDASDIKATFVPSYPFTLVSGDNATQLVGNLQAYQGAYGSENSKTIKYKVLVDKNAPVGNYDFTFTYAHENSASVEVKLPIEVKTANNAQTITIDKTTLIPGKPTDVTFTISNVGNAPLRNLVFTWSNAQDSILTVGGDNTRYIKYLDAGQSTSLPFTVIADTNADAGLYKLDLTLSYENALNSSLTKLVTTTAGMYVGGDTDFDVAYSESSSGQISLSVANVGSNAASSVSVIIPNQPGWRTTGSNTAIVGNLNKGDYTAVSFTLQQQAGSLQNMQNDTRQRVNQTNNTGVVVTSGSYRNSATSTTANMLNVEIAYTNTAGQRQTVTKQVTMSSLAASNTTSVFGTRAASTTQNTSFFSTYKWYIIGIIIIIGGIYWRRKQKIAKLNELRESGADDESENESMNNKQASKKR